MNFIKTLFQNNKKEKPRFTEDTEDMIKGVEELSDTTVKEIMVPRIDVIFLKESIETHNLYQQIIASGHSRFPVYSQTIDDVTGVLHIKDLFKVLSTEEPFNIGKYVRKAYFVPDSMKLNALLREFKRRRVHIAVAVDEYGGVAGIVTLEDILEKIVGDIQDEFDNEEESIVKVGEKSYICDARVGIEELNEKLNINIPTEDCESLGGYVFDLLGKIPVRYEKVTSGGLDFIVQEINGHKVTSIKLIINNGTSSQEGEK